MRAQTSLPALGLALVLLVATTLVAVSVAGEQLAASRSASLERQTASTVAAALVAADAGVTRRANVIDPAALRGLDPNTLVDRYGLDPTAAVRVRLDDRVVLRRGDVEDGAAMERIVLLETRSRRTLEPTFRASNGVTLPRRTRNLSLRIRPGGNTTVRSVRANGRVVLHNPGGLSGRFDVPVSPFRTATLTFFGNGTLAEGDVRVTYWPAVTRKARLRVTVDRGEATDG